MLRYPKYIFYLCSSKNKQLFKEVNFWNEQQKYLHFERIKEYSELLFIDFFNNNNSVWKYALNKYHHNGIKINIVCMNPKAAQNYNQV